MATKPRSSSASSRNDLFSVSWTPEVPPPRPLGGPSVPRLPPPRRNIDEFGLLSELRIPIQSPPEIEASRTSSFFDVSSTPASPPPAPRLSGFVPSPLNLSRSSSLRQAPPAALIPPTRNGSEEVPLSPLHQSPSLPPSASGSLPSWQPPLPPSSPDVDLRLIPNSTYLLGEGRYARVYLASYKKGKGKQKDLLGRYRPRRDASGDSLGGINEEGDGIVGGSWRLCAAKRMAPDRDSQTMGLREAFFLNRLRDSGRARSPLRNGKEREGSVYVVKLIAVKEDTQGQVNAARHGRSSSDVQDGGGLTRPRSSTLINVHPPEEGGLSSFPSLPSLAVAARKPDAPTQPSLSRLVLLLEHAPLGTMDRFLRTSPELVGKELWERWAVQATEALEWVHGKGVVHADVKPGNLLLTMDLDLRLSDFGSSLLVHPSHPPTDGVGLGTLPFSPPELLDPNRSFSFPVDIFALGATLYQCLTGREPFRGLRTIEMMHHVRKGGLWAWSERDRLARIGTSDDSVQGSPYPSAWRAENPDGVRRTGSLRVPMSRPKLPRVSSVESFRTLDADPDSPDGIRAWSNWVTTSSSRGAIATLLAEDDQEAPAPSKGVSRKPSLRSPVPQEEEPPSSPLPTPYEPYEDGSPAMLFLDGSDRVPDTVREVLRTMVDPYSSNRPTAVEVRERWRACGMITYPEEDGGV